MAEPLSTRKLVNGLALIAVTVGVLVAIVGLLAWVVAMVFDRPSTGAAWVFAVGWVVVIVGAIWYRGESNDDR